MTVVSGILNFRCSLFQLVSRAANEYSMVVPISSRITKSPDFSRRVRAGRCTLGLTLGGSI